MLKKVNFLLYANRSTHWTHGTTQRCNEYRGSEVVKDAADNKAAESGELIGVATSKHMHQGTGVLDE
jgi:hypothetical protein